MSGCPSIFGTKNKKPANIVKNNIIIYISFAVVYGWNETVSLVSFGSIPDGLLEPTICNAIT